MGGFQATRQVPTFWKVFEKVVKAVDTDGSGEIDRDEFVMAQKMSDAPRMSKWLRECLGIWQAIGQIAPGFAQILLKLKIISVYRFSRFLSADVVRRLYQDT